MVELREGVAWCRHEAPWDPCPAPAPHPGARRAESGTELDFPHCYFGARAGAEVSQGCIWARLQAGEHAA